MLLKRQQLEDNERMTLMSYAFLSSKSAGRVHPEKSFDERLCFQKDKDRIVHSKAFRRLDAKTQVLTRGSGDHYRTRLTHTLEVAQISRNMARSLGLNEDLAESIALAHDLGHPPFGHGGESALDEILREIGGAKGLHFEHNAQSRRVVEKLEKVFPHFDGLNLTFEVLEGMIKHQTAYDQEGKVFELSAHLEAQVVNIADEIAYTNHDIDDGLRFGVFTLENLKALPLFAEAMEEVFTKYGDFDDEGVLVARTISAMVGKMIEDLCANCSKNLTENRIGTVDDVKNFKGQLADFSPAMRSKIKVLRRFLYDNFYMNPSIFSHIAEGKKMIKELFAFYLKNPEFVAKKRFSDEEEDLIISTKDYIAGMTDLFLRMEFEKHLSYNFPNDLS